MSNRAFLRELKKVDPKALMKKAARCEYLGSRCVEPATWHVYARNFCRVHAEAVLRDGYEQAK